MKIISIKKTVDAYIACGNRIGFFYAEMILMKYLPEEKPNGKCFDVSKSDRQAFIKELKEFVPNGR